ncbi:MAG TPA: hypothetical protein VFB71_10165 [Ramlibacter sp.]|nr:hypothetical protein [Ramlibacter sp.]
MPELNDADPTPPEEVKERLRQAEEKGRALDSPQRTNDSKVDDLCEVLP